MAELEHNGVELSRIHRRNNEKKFFCHFTGFLEGIAASGYVEKGEVAPLIAECEEFVLRASDGDAYDIIEDFQSDLLEHATIADAARLRLSEIDPTCTKSSLNRFLGFCRGIVCDGRITLHEAQGLISYIERNPSIRDVVGVRQIFVTCADAIADGIIDDTESNEICDAIGHVVGDSYGDTGLAQTGGVANFEEYKISDINSDLENKRVVLTGSFSVSPRRIMEERISGFGAIVERAVTRKTDYLFIGGNASRDWIELNRGTKMIKSLKLRQTSNRPLFVSEHQFLRLSKA
ncbi:BRCT domain-containing protein [Frigidibacter sp. ROC022]|uniref:BRCT domain-containing protein n=1 Tax=Frigidibacter sp. ROC022 TaxID=2971796 RepID=UPI00215A9DBC|nr:BRCT domain-containing protein [Frigidibacter sp. ROC022]MCR8724004.1 hypothetical protein [Frigidibacter sp. ROC022]